MAETTDRITVADVTRLPHNTPAATLAALMADPQGLAAVTLAEATGRAPHAARNLLASPDWCEDWLYTLVGLEGTLRVAVARAELHGNPSKARNNWNNALHVSQRIPHARQAVAKARRKQMREQNNTPIPKTLDIAARAALAIRYGPEYGQLHGKLLRADGLGDLKTLPTNDDEFFTIAINCGLLTPATPEAAALTTLPWTRFRHIVADDVKDEHGINGLLRDPVVAPSWGRALVELHATTCDQLGIATDGPAGDFPVLTLNLGALPREEAFRHVRQLRFLAALRQRYVEQQRLARDLKHRASQRREQLVKKAGDAAVDMLIERHPDTYRWLLARLAEYADPVTGFMGPEYLAGRKRILTALFARLDHTDKESHDA